MKQSERPLSRSKRNIQCGLPIDSLTLVAFGGGVNSDHSNDSMDDCDENLHPRSSNMLLSSDPCDVKKIGNNTLWTCSTLLTGLSLNESRNTKQSSLIATKQHTASRAQVDKKQQRGSYRISKKSNKSIPLVLNNGLSSFLCNNPSDADSENEIHYHQRVGMKKNSTHRKTTNEQKTRGVMPTSNNLNCQILNQQKEKFRESNTSVNDEILSNYDKKDHTIGRHLQQKHVNGTNRNQKYPSKRMLTQQESDLFLAITQKETSKPLNNHDFDSNASLSSHSVQGNLLSLFQSQMVVSKQNRTNSLHPSSSNNDQLPAAKTTKSKKRSQIASIFRTSSSDNKNNSSNNNNVQNHHPPSPFASPQPTESRRHNKRRDRKNTPNIKSGIVHCCLKKGSNNATIDTKIIPGQGQDSALSVENIETLPLYEDDTTSSLSDDSLSGIWNGNNENHAENSVHPVLESSIQLETGAIEVSLDVKKNESTLYVSSDTDDSIRNGKGMVVDGSDKNDEIPSNEHITTSSVGFKRSNVGNDDVSTATNLEFCYPDEQLVQGSSSSKILTDSLEITHNDVDNTEKVQETTSQIIGITDYPLNESTHDDSMNISKIHEYETGGVRRSNRARTITNRFTVTESGKTSSQRHIHPILQLKEQRQVQKSKANIAKKITGKESKAVAFDTTKVDRPRRDRKRTDFYHNHLRGAPENIDGNKPDAICGITYNNVLSPRAVLIAIENDQESHWLEPAATVNPKMSRGIPATNVQGESDDRGLKSEKESLSIADCDKWSMEQLQQLEDAKDQVDPTSTTYWIDVSNMVQGKSALECQTKWFVTAKTPVPKTKHTRSKLPSKIDNVLEEEDDIFQSTPMRNNAYSDTIFGGTFDPIIMPKLPISAIKSTEIVDDEADVAHSFMIYNMKPIPKTFLQRMKRDFTKEKHSHVSAKTSQGQIPTKNPVTRAFTEVLRNEDIDINIRLTPGGTLKVKSQLNEEEDDFWDDEYDADEENENMIGPFY